MLVDGDIRGFVRISNVASHRIESLDEVLAVGAVKAGVILGIMKEEGKLEVSLKQEHIDRGEDYWIANRKIDESMMKWWTECGKGEFDIYFDEKQALASFVNARAKYQATLGIEAQKFREGSSVQQRQSQQRPRLSFHPAFKNVSSFKAAEEQLRGKGAGEVLFRPSSSGGLSLTWAFQEGWYKHIAIEEVDRRAGDQTIGDKLVVKDYPEQFSSLDEILARYIDPMNDLVARMVGYRSFQTGQPESVEGLMRAKYEENRKCIPLFVRFDPKQPGCFVLTWFIGESSTPVRTEYVGIAPEGYKVRGKLFPNPSAVVQWFKMNVMTSTKSTAGSSSAKSLQKPQNMDVWKTAIPVVEKDPSGWGGSGW